MMTLEKARGSYIVFYASLLHIPWAMVLLVNPTVHLATPIAGFYWLLKSPVSVAALLILVSISAAVGKMFVESKRKLLLCLIPQQFILMVSAAASCVSIYDSKYADGYAAPRDFIFNDQWPNILAMIVHTYYVATLVGHPISIGRNKS